MQVKPIILFVPLLIVHLAMQAQTITWDSVRPHTTDATIEEGAYNIRHYVAKTNLDTMNTLVVFLPGTYRAPVNYLFITEQLARMGYHVIGLMYKTNPAINPICRGTDDETCHWRARMETVDGTDRHPTVSVNLSNSINNRLAKLLQWLINKYPSGGWDQYYSSNQIQWSKIIVAGHSQGASLAGVMGQAYPLKRVVMFSVMDVLDSGKIPNWVNDETKGPRYYAFFHTKDELVSFTSAQVGWDKLGMAKYGSMANADCRTYPFNYSHILYTTYEPSTSLVDKYHNGTTLDVYINGETAYKNSLKEALRYLFRKM
jgi:hypothetical protein